MPEFVTLKHTETGGEWQCPDEPAVLAEQFKKGFVVIDPATGARDPNYDYGAPTDAYAEPVPELVQDPKFGTYDAAPAPESPAGDEQAATTTSEEE